MSTPLICREGPGWPCYSLNDIAKEEDMYSGFDEERLCDIVDLDRMKEEIRILGISHKNMIIEAHYAHEMPSDLIFVLRTDPSVLKKRMEKRKYWTSKLSENLEAEIMDVIGEEARENRTKVFEIETSKTTPEQAASMIKNLINIKGDVIKDLKIPEEVRPKLRQHFGEIMKGDWKEIIKKIKREIGGEVPLTISVGDHCSYHFIRNGFVPDIIIVDNIERRKPFREKIDFSGDHIKVKNKAGNISKDLWKTLEDLLKNYETGKRTKIEVKGEEDLAALPCMIFAPDGTYIFYGMWDKGMMKIRVNENVKREALSILHEIIDKQNK